MPEFINSARIRGSARGSGSEGSDTHLETLKGRELLIAAGLPPYAALVAQGNTWSMATATASAFNHVAALPTTLAVAILYNGEPSGGKSYVIHTVWATTIVSTAALTPLSLLTQVTPNPAGAATAPTHSATTTLIRSRSGKASYTGLAKRAVNVTTFFTDMWDVVAHDSGAATANIAGGVVADIGGGIIIPPAGALGINVLAGTVSTAGGIVGCSWSEVQLDLA